MARKALLAKTYYGTAGSTAATELTNIKNQTVSLTKNEADITVRGSTWDLFLSTTKTASIDFDMVYDETDAGFNAIRNAFLNDTVLAFYFIPYSGGSGLDADFEIMKWDEKADIKDAIIISVSLKPTYVTRYPTIT